MARGRPHGRRFPLAAVVFLVVAIGAAGGLVLVLLRPHVDFTNSLAAPVQVVVGSEPARTLTPGASVRVRLPRSSTAAVVQWSLIRPLSADRQPMGEEIRGSTVLPNPSGTVRLRAASRTTDTAYFAPLITNASTRPLRVLVNAGLAGAVDCGCMVRPGTRRVFIGYYRLYRNSTVQVRAPASGAAAGLAEFRDLGLQVASPDGTVGLRFEDKDLR
ncbi:MAG: hypothetical protein ACTHM9_01060 [Gemmatimonadales bacterium]